MPPVASSNGGCGLPPASSVASRSTSTGSSPRSASCWRTSSIAACAALAGQHAGVGLQHAHRRRAGLRHGAAQSRHRLVQAPAQVEHHRLVIAVQRAQRLALVETRQRASALVGAAVLREQHPGVDERHRQTGDALSAMACSRRCALSKRPARTSSRVSSSSASATAGVLRGQALWPARARRRSGRSPESGGTADGADPDCPGP